MKTTILFPQKLRKFSLCTIFTRIAYHKNYLSSQYVVFLHVLLTVYHVVSHVSSSVFLNCCTSLYQFLALISTWKVKIMIFLQYASLISLIYFTLLNTLEIFHTIYFYTFNCDCLYYFLRCISCSLDYDFKLSELWPVFKTWSRWWKQAIMWFVLSHYVGLASELFILCSAFLHLFSLVRVRSKKLIFPLKNVNLLIYFKSKQGKFQL